jgi:hypothetical protein
MSPRNAGCHAQPDDRQQVNHAERLTEPRDAGDHRHEDRHRGERELWYG